MRAGFFDAGGARSSHARTSHVVDASPASCSSPSLASIVSSHWPFGHRYLPSADGHDDNLMIMFHGRGDSPGPFATLATALNLPCTAALVLAGPLEVPFTAGKGAPAATVSASTHLCRTTSRADSRRRASWVLVQYE